MWIWRRGRRRRRAEHKIAARLVTNAILEIRFYAQQGPEHLTRIRELADVVHNLPGGILGGGERGREPYGYHTFRWMWETASAEQRGWLVAQFEPLDYDYSYLERAPSPAPRKPVRRSPSTKTVNAATLLTLDPAAAFEAMPIPAPSTSSCRVGWTRCRSTRPNPAYRSSTACFG